MKIMGKMDDQLWAQKQAHAELVRWNRESLPYEVLFQLGRAEELGLQYRVRLLGKSVEVTVSAGPGDFSYFDEASVEVYQEPDNAHVTKKFEYDEIHIFIDRVIAAREEKKRIEAVKRAALDKLTEEEKRALGLIK